ncbi:DUF429 domain-containing protein [Candidatus Woesearchaeota archaeon]|nr:DUF429 domain-containing protein [Candidatus Woesearchaeota archaeon]
MFFVGLDLAWSNRNPSGVAIINEHLQIVHISIHDSDANILKTIFSIIQKSPTIIGIDAPLIVPNEDGSRPGEQLLNKEFRKHHAGAHPANRKRLSSWTGSIRGEDISIALEQRKFTQSFLNKPKESGKRFYEVFPHPATITLFRRDKIIPYKNKPGRTYESRWQAFKEYQNAFYKLLPCDFLKQKVIGMRGRALKDYEDQIDALLCAYIVFFYWKNPKKCTIFGDLDKGYILTPTRL